MADLELANRGLPGMEVSVRVDGRARRAGGGVLVREPAQIQSTPDLLPLSSPATSLPPPPPPHQITHLLCKPPG